MNTTGFPKLLDLIQKRMKSKPKALVQAVDATLPLAPYAPAMNAVVPKLITRSKAIATYATNAGVLAVVMISFGLSACATKPKESAVSLKELSQIRVTDRSCRNIEQSVQWLEHQQRLAGIPQNVNPEQLTPYQREYNANIRIRIWALRIGCNNPTRYAG